MKEQCPEQELSQESSTYSQKISPTIAYRQRRRLEMKKRIGVLNYRRERLERELEVIRAALSVLDRQIQRDTTSDGLPICDRPG